MIISNVSPGHSSSTYYSRSSRKNVDLTILNERAMEKCVQRIPISAMCNRVSKKSTHIMVIGNHGCFEEK